MPNTRTRSRYVQRARAPVQCNVVFSRPSTRQSRLVRACLRQFFVPFFLILSYIHTLLSAEPFASRTLYCLFPSSCTLPIPFCRVPIYRVFFALSVSFVVAFFLLYILLCTRAPPKRLCGPLPKTRGSRAQLFAGAAAARRKSRECARPPSPARIIIILIIQDTRHGKTARDLFYFLYTYI